MISNNEQVRTYKLCEIATVVRGSSPRPFSDYVTTDPNGIVWCKQSDAPANSIYIDKTEQRIKESGLKKARFVRKGSILIAASMAIGKSAIMTIDGCIYDGWFAVYDYEEKAIPEYLLYVLQSKTVVDYMIKKATNGTTIPNLTVDDIKSLEIPLPNREEQCRKVTAIKKYLSVQDSYIGLLEKELGNRKKQRDYYVEKILEK